MDIWMARFFGQCCQNEYDKQRERRHRLDANIERRRKTWRAKEKLNASTHANALTISEVGDSSRPAVRSSQKLRWARGSVRMIYFVTSTEPTSHSISRVSRTVVS